MFDQLSVLCWKLSMRVVSNKLIGVGDEFYIYSTVACTLTCHVGCYSICFRDYCFSMTCLN